MEKFLIKQAHPEVSVVMSVFNGETYLREAIDSVLTQTFKDFEFIIINDGSTDGTLKIIQSYTDPRIQLISRENKGLVASLNEGIKQARGRYIARQDADDISLPHKLAQQVQTIETNQAVLVSTAFSMFSTDPGAVLDCQCLINNDVVLKREFYAQNPFGHGATMFSREAAVRVGMYEDVGPVEDYDLWAKLMHEGKFSYAEEVCYLWRINPQGISQTETEHQQHCARAVRTNRLTSEPPDLQLSDVESVIEQIRALGEGLRQSCLRRVIHDQKVLTKRALKKLHYIQFLRDLRILFMLKRSAGVIA